MTDDNALPRRAFVAGLLGAGFAAEAVPMTARWNGPQVRGSGWLEWRLVTTQGGFDPAQFDIGCDFTGTQGEALSVTAFWDGKHWVMRLLPPATGTWHAAPRGLGQPFTFKVDKVVARQHIGIDPQDPRYFAFDDGSPFVPIGLNICWASSRDTTLAEYRRWFQRLADSGGNFARLWMASWSFGIEWTDTGLGNYGARMNRAAELDAVFELAESLGLKLMLCLINHGAFTEKNDAEWQANPYNKANGGPLAAPEDFVTDEQAMLLFERRVRYIAARWAHSPALHSWEWWNEVTWTPIKAAALRPWFTRMTKVLDAHDPYRRLRSSSWADRGDAVAWQMPELEYAQQHDYTTRDLMLHYADAARAWEADGIAAKPLFASELGLETTFDAKAPRSPAFNFDAVHLHNGLWAPLFNASRRRRCIGGGITWSIRSICGRSIGVWRAIWRRCTAQACGSRAIAGMRRALPVGRRKRWRSRTKPACSCGCAPICMTRRRCARRGPPKPIRCSLGSRATRASTPAMSISTGSH